MTLPHAVGSGVTEWTFPGDSVMDIEPQSASDRFFALAVSKTNQNNLEDRIEEKLLTIPDLCNPDSKPKNPAFFSEIQFPLLQELQALHPEHIQLSEPLTVLSRAR